MKRNNRKGFTTVELVIVIAVIAILATALIPTFAGLINSANDTASLQEARETFNNALVDDLNIFTGKTAYILVEGDNGDIYYPVVNGKLDTKNTVKGDSAPTADLIIKAADSDPYYVCTHAKYAVASTINAEGKCEDCGVETATAHEHCTFCDAVKP